MSTPIFTPSIRTWLVALVLFAVARPATAEDAWPEQAVLRPVTLPRGLVQLGGDTVLVNVASGALAEPVSFAPTLRYGVTDDITVGVTHRMPVPYMVGAGLCVDSVGGGCDRVYDNVGLDAAMRLMHRPGLELAARLGVHATSLHDSLYGVRPAVIFKAHGKRFGLVAEPAVYIGVTHRDRRFGLFADDQAGLFPHDIYIDVPLTLTYQASPALEARVTTGLHAPGQDFGDLYSVPVGIGALFNVNAALDIGLDFVFPNLLGASWYDRLPGAVPGQDLRSEIRALIVHVALRP